MMGKNNRRKFIQNSFYSSLGLFLSTKFANFQLVAQALSGDVGQSFLEHKFINFFMDGGGSRYYWDLPLQPNGTSDPLAFNPMCITRYGSNILGNGEYRVTKLGDYYFPEIWNNDIPTVSGKVSMKSISENMLVIRGVELSNGGHDAAREMQLMPEPGKSLMGVVADASSLSLPAVGMSHAKNWHYHSEKGVPIVEGGSNAFSAFNPHSSEGMRRSVNSSTVESGIDQALLALKDQFQSKHRYLPSTLQQRINAKNLLKKEYSGLNDTFSTLENKYEELIRKSFQNAEFRVPGVEDRAIPGDGSAKFQLGLNSFYNGSDYRECFDSETSLSKVASHFAVAEFMVLNGFTSTFTASSTGMANSLKNNFTSGSGRTSIVYDQHDTGSHVALLAYTKMYKAYSSLIYEFNNKLKNKTNGNESMFDKSLVALTGDFNRSARMNGSGSDHGSDGTNYTIFSGMVPKLTVIGNTSNNASGSWAGSWGVAAPLKENNNSKITIGNISSTICEMVGSESITPNAKSLVNVENGTITSIAGKPETKVS